ncbi:MAG: toxin [Patescibacteria group bacterium]|nr:toxin [Patescibacteria group bacterium]
MKYFDWSSKKNERLRIERGISFEDVLIAIDEKKILDIVEHKNQKRYPDQKIFIVDINSYAYLIPFVEDKYKIFLKTIIPSRKATKKYILKINNK